MTVVLVYAQAGSAAANGIVATAGGVSIDGLSPRPDYDTVAQRITHSGGDFVITFSGEGISDGRGTHIDGVSLIQLAAAEDIIQAEFISVVFRAVVLWASLQPPGPE
ncbi:MAG: hypothetical protein AAFV45_03825 [Pseudomonadota bacterium]